MFSTGAADIGRVGLPPTGRGANYEAGGMVFAGGPNETADRLLTVREHARSDPSERKCS